ncbi:DNA alkylation repair protein [Patescibacteria group bacterium]
MEASELKKELKKYASTERKKTNEWFFKTGKGEYGEHDMFLGITTPDMRKIAKSFTDISLLELSKVLSSKYNEERETALIILTNKYKKGGATEQKKVYDFYMQNLKHINNWNLVDVSAPNVVGEYLFEHKKEQKILNELVKSKSLWERRVSILATWAFIKRNDFKWTLKNAKILLADTHDLTHKAVGWMLREVWKKSPEVCEKFLKDNYAKVPRTTLRYAIERMEELKRKKFLKGEF